MQVDLAKWHSLIIFMIYFNILGPKVLAHLVGPIAQFRRGVYASLDELV